MSSILSTAKTALAKFSDPDLRALTSDETLNFESLRARKTAIFLIIPENEVRYYSFLLTILYTQMFNFCSMAPQHGQLYNPIFFFLDEFANSGKLPNFSTVITSIRKKKTAISIVLQDVEQLVNVYGKADASVILNGGCASRIFYPGLSYSTCRELSNLLGNQTIRYRESGFSRKDGYFPDRDRNMARSLLTPDEIRTLSDNRALFIHGNLLPVLLKTTPWFKNKKLIRKTKM